MMDVVKLVDQAETEEEYNELIAKHSNVLLYDDGVYSAIVEDPSIASLLSVDGIIKVGDEIRKIEKEIVKVIKDGDLSKIYVFDEVIDSDNSYGIEVEPIVRLMKKTNWQKSFYKVVSGTTYRVDAKKWATSYGTWNTMGGSVIHYHQTKNWLGNTRYLRNKASRLQIWVSWDARSYYFTSGGVRTDVEDGSGSKYDSDYNANDVDAYVQPCGGMVSCGPISVTNFKLKFYASTMGTYEF